MTRTRGTVAVTKNSGKSLRHHHSVDCMEVTTS